MEKDAMPNIGAVLKHEIARLSRREIRAQVQTTKKASAQYRRDIAALKRDFGALKRQVALLHRTALGRQTEIQGASTTKKVRFVPKGLRSQRDRVGLSAEDYGRLVGVSAQSIYNWERGHTTPRQEQLRAIVALRGISKRVAEARLQQMRAKGAERSSKR
jgi:DNA-binding transcriptional regulator YiaG